MDFYNSNSYTYNPCYNNLNNIYLNSYSNNEFQQSNFINYTSCDNLHYSTSSFTDPKTCHYDPSYRYVDDGDYNLFQTRYMVSYSEVQKFNDDEYFEYDPTPYGGGYDPVLTYGKPLSPSDEICYPRSVAVDSSYVDPVAEVSSNGVLALPFVENKVVEEEESKKPQMEEVKMDKAQENGTDQEEETHEKLIDYTPNWSDFDSGHQNIRPEYDYSYEKERRVVESQSGYGSNVVDLCESLFGYWPGLSQQKDEENKSYGGQTGAFNTGDGNRMAQWNGTAADYLFGSSNSYGDLRIVAGMYDSPIFGYEKHYQEPLLYGQIQYDPNFYDCRIYENEV